MAIRELFRRFPSSRRIPHVELADLPTPVQQMPRVARQLELDELWVKRDDLTGRLYGGNKVRKLEFLLAEARGAGHDAVWTVGGIGSHHCLATCILARELALGCGVVQFAQPITPHVQRNIRALSTTSPRVHLLRGVDARDIGRAVKQWRAAHPELFYIPGGGSSATGALGYVNAALELAAQIEQGELPRPDVIVVAAGTCGTLAGLRVGVRLAGLDIDVRGIRVVDEWVASAAVVSRIAGDAVKMLRDAGVAAEYPDDEVFIDDRFFGDGYGVPTAAGVAAMELATLDGLVLEPTYTAKAFAAVAHGAPAFAGKTVLYWHTLSGADLTARIAEANLDALPPEYRCWAEQEPEFS